MQDVKLWGSLPGSAKEGPFCDNTEARAAPSELRIGVTFEFDRFGFTRSSFVLSHSTGALLLSVTTLHNNLRCPEVLPARDGPEHLCKAQEYANLDTKQEHDMFFAEHSTRYFELSRLPYFDPVKMSIIDPMHNIILGVVKTQWYDTRIQTKTLHPETSALKTTCELNDIHEHLKAAAEEENTCKLKQWETNKARCVKRVAREKHLADGSIGKPAPKPAKPRIQQSDIGSLSAAFKILFTCSVNINKLPRAQELLENYLHGFLKILNYGPVYGFWMFIFKCLSKMLKSYKVNNHGGGKLEVTFFQEYQQEIRLRTMHAVSVKLAVRIGHLGSIKAL
ncbi:hypothetical protein PHLGIDRAFT_503171 [Phlebiopsis gigantea 11061_1 CR5-6]|uniref:Uncharacterized protein n=1 Tax=Phlebiopsis gigantea (strain 11061_1 CR5-6) TaxID=745531 RepID=A0A0C3RZU5_PHLG1|nr:hypothetical protein PHLGIDRAFT_503171 [Phlebiopsis gigantea 11061_1 CR5-6]